MTPTQTRMVALIRDLLGEVVTDLDAPLACAPTLDSLDLIGLTMQTEEVFGVEISDDEADPFTRPDGGKTVREWCALVDGKLAAKVAA